MFVVNGDGKNCHRLFFFRHLQYSHDIRGHRFRMQFIQCNNGLDVVAVFVFFWGKTMRTMAQFFYVRRRKVQHYINTVIEYGHFRLKIDGISRLTHYRLVGDGLNPEKINIKAFLVSFCSARYDERHIENPRESPLGKTIGRALKFMIFSCILSGTFVPRLDISLKKMPRPSNLHTTYLSRYSRPWYSPTKYFPTGSICFRIYKLLNTPFF